MDYIISTRVNVCEYWIQEKNGELIRNGLIDNATVYPTRVKALDKFAIANATFPRNTFTIDEIGNKIPIQQPPRDTH